FGRRPRLMAVHLDLGQVGEREQLPVDVAEDRAQVERTSRQRGRLVEVVLVERELCNVVQALRDAEAVAARGVAGQRSGAVRASRGTAAFCPLGEGEGA